MKDTVNSEEISSLNPEDPENQTNVLNAEERLKIMSGTSYKKLYSLFRGDGMSVFESFYNAVYISSHNRYEATATMKMKFEEKKELQQ